MAYDEFNVARRVQANDDASISTSRFSNGYRTVNDDDFTTETTYVDGIRSRQVIDRVDGNGQPDSVRTFDGEGALEAVSWTTEQGLERTNLYQNGHVSAYVSVDASDMFDFANHRVLLERGEVVGTLTEFDTGLVRQMNISDGRITSRSLTDGGNEYDWHSRDYAYDDAGNITGIRTVWDDMSVTDLGTFLS